MTKKKVVYIVPMAPPKSFSNSFFVKEICASNIECEYWDIADILNYDLNNPPDTEMNSYKISTLKELYQTIRKEDKSNTVFVPQLSDSLGASIVFWLLRLLGCKTVFFGRGYLPSHYSVVQGKKCSRITRIFNMLVSGRVLFVIKTTINLMLKKLIPAKNFDISFVSGYEAERRHSIDSKRTVHINHIDVDTAICGKVTGKKLPGSYWVFLDEYLPFHPDWSISESDTIDPERYYQEIRCFFEMIEAEKGTEVIVAAHPKSSYESEVFGGRKVYKGMTNELVKNAEVVLTHASTAVSFAVIYKKPLCLLTSKDIIEKHPGLGGVIAGTGKLLKCKVWDYKSKERADLVPNEVDKRSYEAYYTEYLSALESKEHSSDIVIRTLDKLWT